MEKNIVYADIINRLTFALKINELELSKKLGLKQTTLSNRKTKNSDKFEDVMFLCKREGLNINWVFFGEGEPFKISSNQTSRDVTNSTMVNGSFNGSTNSNVSVGGSGESHNGMVKSIIDKVTLLKDDFHLEYILKKIDSLVMEEKMKARHQ